MLLVVLFHDLHFLLIHLNYPIFDALQVSRIKQIIEQNKYNIPTSKIRSGKMKMIDSLIVFNIIRITEFILC